MTCTKFYKVGSSFINSSTKNTNGNYTQTLTTLSNVEMNLESVKIKLIKKYLTDFDFYKRL